MATRAYASPGGTKISIAEQDKGDGEAPDAEEDSGRVPSGPCESNQAERSSQGMTRSLQTIVDRAMVSTMTMPVAADRPPMKAKRARPLAPSDKGRVGTKVSASPPVPPKRNRPPRARGRQRC